MWNWSEWTEKGKQNEKVWKESVINALSYLMKEEQQLLMDVK